MDQSQQVRRQFFADQNEQMLLGMLAKNFQQRLGAPLTDNQSSHLERALEHYMSDVFQQNPYQTTQTLNKQVLSATASEFNAYLQRQTALKTATPQLFMETSNRFEQAQQDRQRSLEAPRPSIPDYVQPIQIKEDDSISALALFEEAKKRRGAEMNSQAEAEAAKRSSSAMVPIYAQAQQDRPDPRAMFAQPLNLMIEGSLVPTGSGLADVNPTIARPGPLSVPSNRGTLQQDLIIKQEDIQMYKETEYNLSVYSADRKWEFNTEENRFNFSVNLYSGNPTNGVSIMPKATARFRNIVKIEFVKAVMPIENTDIIVQKSGATTYDTSYLKNVFGYPFITLNVEELDTNNFGTNDKMDNAFAILQYDANWTDNTASLGFTSYIPKHMKCQRVYSPTPLASLTKLSVRLQQPNGNLINTVPDTLDINGACLSITADILTFTAIGTNNTNYKDSTGEYIWIDCKKWFSRYQVAAGDRIQIRNLSSPTSPTAAQTDFLNYMQDPSGLMVVATAYNTSAPTLELGSNSAGYARFIIVRSKFGDPTTGSTSVDPYGRAANNTALSTFLTTARFTSGRLINLSHQTQLIFRIVTRDYDSSSLMRPDNL
jgi:hypothetical protein